MKEWQHLLQGFCGKQRSRPLFSSSSSSSQVVECSQQREQAISWSSSDEDDPKCSKLNTSAVASSVVVRLDFDAGTPRPSGRTKATVSRDVNKSVNLNPEPPKSPILQWSQRRAQISGDIFADTEEEKSKSPILETKKRSSPILHRKRRNFNLELDYKTPEKQSATDLAATSPVFTAKRRKGQLTRGKVEIVELESQPHTEEDVGTILKSPLRSPTASDNSSIILVNSPIIMSQKKRSGTVDKQLQITVNKNNCRPTKSTKEKFVIVDESQETREILIQREQKIDSFSSQDANLVQNPTNIYSVSSVSDVATASQEQSSDNSNPVNVTDNAPPIDPTQIPRKRPAKNSLLQRLQKIKNRQRSLLRMWHHERQSGSRQTKGLVLQILSLSTMGPKVVAHGRFTKSLQKTVIVFHQEQIKRGGIKMADFIKIYPPWQTFNSSVVNVPIILSLNLFEKVEQPFDFIQFDASNDAVNLKEFSCQCSSDPDIGPSECTTTLHKQGLELMDHLLKSSNTTGTLKLRAVEELDCSNEEGTDEQSQNQLFTISDAIEVYAKKSTTPLQLRLACQRIFISKKVRRKDISSHLSQSSQLCEEVWLMLGQDANEVLCFVEVKGDFRDKIKEGSSYFLKGLSLAKRQQLSGKPDVLDLMASFSSVGKESLNIYKFSTSRGSTVENSIAVQPWAPPILCKLSFVNQDSNGRISLAMNLLALEGNRLYCTDPYQAKQAVPYLIIPIKAQTVIPKLQTGTAIYLRDLICTKGDITTDDFTLICSIGNLPKPMQDFVGANPVEEWINGKLKNKVAELTNIKPKISNMKNASKNGDLVTVKGTICEVDEDNSYSWPNCTNCGSEFLQDLPDGTICCSVCRSEGPFTDNVALSVFACLSKEFQLSDPNTKILIKLLQETVELLLPGWNQSKEYGLEAVLGQEIGPIVCTIENDKTVSLRQVPY